METGYKNLKGRNSIATYSLWKEVGSNGVSQSHLFSIYARRYIPIENGYSVNSYTQYYFKELHNFQTNQSPIHEKAIYRWSSTLISEKFYAPYKWRICIYFIKSVKKNCQVIAKHFDIGREDMKKRCFEYIVSERFCRYISYDHRGRLAQGKRDIWLAKVCNWSQLIILFAI